jgi:hypothetical protein
MFQEVKALAASVCSFARQPGDFVVPASRRKFCLCAAVLYPASNPDDVHTSTGGGYSACFRIAQRQHRHALHKTQLHPLHAQSIQGNMSPPGYPYTDPCLICANKILNPVPCTLRPRLQSDMAQPPSSTTLKASPTKCATGDSILRPWNPNPGSSAIS